MSTLQKLEGPRSIGRRHLDRRTHALQRRQVGPSRGGGWTKQARPPWPQP